MCKATILFSLSLSLTFNNYQTTKLLSVLDRHLRTVYWNLTYEKKTIIKKQNNLTEILNVSPCIFINDFNGISNNVIIENSNSTARMSPLRGERDVAP